MKSLLLILPVVISQTNSKMGIPNTEVIMNTKFAPKKYH